MTAQNDASEVRDAKSHLRDEARLGRVKAQADAGTGSAIHFADHFFAGFKPDPDQIIAGYVPIGTEADPGALLAHAHDTGHRCALPRIVARGAVLAFHRWAPGDTLVAGDHGTREPVLTHDHLRPDIVIVPLLAFDAQGNRLGYGGGYYDRTIAALRSDGRPIKVIGLAFSAQSFDLLPAGPHDERLDAIVTETGVLHFSDRPE
ncbi:MAG: 5-formyltetrahydrofolate cyclo-ligase [Rhizobiales bacterium]|nr:5-formyltetrahydrofolate cyclo-ligase [Hyphomicrobiales bacterium]